MLCSAAFLHAGLITVGHSVTGITVGENARMVEVCVVIINGENLRPFSVSVSTVNSSAGLKYGMVTSTNLIITFSLTYRLHRL